MKYMPNFRSGNSKANIEYETFKKKYDTKSFKTEFKQKYEAAIKEIKSNKGPPIPAVMPTSKIKPAKASIYTSQKALIEYYVNAKLVDAELYTILVFDKLNEFAKTSPDTPQYDIIKTLNMNSLAKIAGNNDEVIKRNQEMANLIENALLVSTDEDLHKNPDFIRLLVLLLTIRYYTYTIVDTIFQNGKNNIESIIKNITTMNNHTDAIQNIVDRIDPGDELPPTIVDAEGVVVDDPARVAAVVAKNRELRDALNIPGSRNNPIEQASNFLSGLFPPGGGTGGGQIGGVNDDVVTILNTISRAQVINDPAISHLVKYSTNLLCNALTLLSVSISFPSIKSPSLRAIMPQVYTNMTKFFIDHLFAQKNIDKFPSLAGLKNALIEVITGDNFANIISNITKISNISNTNNTITTVASGDATAVEPVAYNRPEENISTTLSIDAAYDSVRELIDQQLAGEDQSLITSANDAGNKIITSYYSNGRLSVDYITEVATAIVSVFQANKLSYSPNTIADVCTIAAVNSKHKTDYRDFVKIFFDNAKELLKKKTKLETAPPDQLISGGALPENYNFEFNLQASIIKGIERSTFFRLNNVLTEPEVVAEKIEGGQRTQKNRKRNMNRGGTRRNINSYNSNNSNNSNNYYV
jgi:hypothetical protein